MRVKKWIINNLGLKILSLALAIATWFYVNQEFARRKTEEEKAIIKVLHYEVVTKKIPIQLIIVGKLKSEYEIVSDGIVISPESCVVIGPEIILRDVSAVRTLPIDISEYTKDVNREIALAPIAEGITLKDYFVKVYIPIVKKPEVVKTQE